MRINHPVNNHEYQLSDTQAIVSMTDPKGRITYVNPYFIEVSGFDEDELLGKAHNLVRHPDMPPEAFEDLWNTLHEGIPWTGLVKNRRKDGGFYWVQANVTPIYEGGQVTGYMSVRNKPARESIAAVEPIYRQFREGRAQGLAIRQGQVVRTGLRGWLSDLVHMGLFTQLGLGLGVLASGLAGLGLSAWLGHTPSSGALGALAGGGLLVIAWFWVKISRWLIRPLRQATQVARTLAGGDMSQQIEVRQTGEVGQLLRALMQVSVNLNTIVRDVRGSVDSIKGDASEIASGNMSLSQRTEAQAASLEQTTASIEQFVVNMRQGTDNTSEANQLASEASTIAERGGQVIANFGATMNEISDSASKIIDIIALIDGIAFQTNILALNASVEAARAGEQGRGFAVVAGEVRGLAGRSAAAAKEIKLLIGDSIDKVQAGSRQVGEATSTMGEVVKAVNNVALIMRGLSLLSHEQSQGMSQINTAVLHLDSVTQQNAAMVEETAAASENMVQRAIHLQRAVEVFKLARSAV